jgi:hypothetical protein
MAMKRTSARRECLQPVSKQASGGAISKRFCSIADAAISIRLPVPDGSSYGASMAGKGAGSQGRPDFYLQIAHFSRTD